MEPQVNTFWPVKLGKLRAWMPNATVVGLHGEERCELCGRLHRSKRAGLLCIRKAYLRELSDLVDAIGRNETAICKVKRLKIHRLLASVRIMRRG